MPNHVTTVCTVTGPAPAIEAFRAKHIVAGEKGAVFDFKTIIPMPECVEGTQSGSQADLGRLALYGVVKPATLPTAFAFLEPPADEQIARECRQRGVYPATRNNLLAWVEKNAPEALALGERSQRAFVETGHADWYDWSIAAWGTKWGAYDMAERPCADGYRFEFQTAWSFPGPIFAKLETLHPDLIFACATFDEGWNFAGLGEFGRGAATRFRPVAATDEMYEMVYGRKPTHDGDES